jgi:hypothetical protein
MSPPSNQAQTPAQRDAVRPLTTVALPNLEITLQAADILRNLGVPPDTAPPPDLVRQIGKLLREAKGHLRPAGAYSIYLPGAWTARSFEIGGCTIAGNVRDVFKGADRIAVFVATAGDEIERQVKMRRDAGDASAGRILDAIGSWAAERAAEALVTQMGAHLGPGESFTARYSPGFCGMELSEQRTLFRLVPAGAVGITLLPSLFMQPLKSISGFIGLGPRSAVGVHLSPCELCPLTGCHMRR